MENMLSKYDYLTALSKAPTDSNAHRLMVRLIDQHLTMVEHMKKTSLWDVYTYEDRIAKNTFEPMEFLLYENEKLKKEVNKLRRRLGEIEKYKEKENGSVD